MGVKDTANVGNALLCGKALGLYSSLKDAASRMATTQERVWYERGAEAYERQYPIFLELHDQLEGTFRRSASLG